MDKPFWEKTYQDDRVATFGVQPNRIVAELWQQFEKKWMILDVGCGEGKNPLFLARQGFENLHAFDKSQAGIEKLQRLAGNEKLKIHAWVDDLTTYAFPKAYDLIMSFGTLHFVEKEAWRHFILESQKYTTPKGINIFQIFTTKIPASPDIAPFVKGMADEGELAGLYSDWEIIRSEARVFEDRHPGVEPHMHASNMIVARKKE